jgi:hypothetical protein
MHCGKGLRRNTSATLGSHCPRCGRFDQLNTRFCVYCGSDTASNGTSAQEVKKLTWEVETPKGKSAQILAPRGEKETFWLMGAAVLAAALGATTSILFAPIMQRASAQTAWPHSSLVLYTNHRDAQVVIEPSRQARNFTVGKVGRNGALRVTSLPPGQYIVAVSAPNFQTSVVGIKDELKVDEDNPTIIGYPDRLELVPKHSQDDQ